MSEIYNGDETGLYSRALPDYTYVFKNQNDRGIKSSKERITLLYCVSMVGEKKIFFVIGIMMLIRLPGWPEICLRIGSKNGI